MNINMNTYLNHTREAYPGLSQASSKNDVAMSVMKRAINIEAEGAKSLIASVPQAASYNAYPLTSAENLPAHLGKHINVAA